MSKTKNNIYLFAATFFFLSIFFVKIDKVRNVAKAAADTCECEDGTFECACDPGEAGGVPAVPSDTGTATQSCSSDSHNDPITGACVPNNSGLPNSEDLCSGYGDHVAPNAEGSCVCTDGYDWNADETACVKQESGATCHTTGDCINALGKNGYFCDTDTDTCQFSEDDQQKDANCQQGGGAYYDDATKKCVSLQGECGGGQTLVNGVCVGALNSECTDDNECSDGCACLPDNKGNTICQQDPNTKGTLGFGGTKCQASSNGADADATAAAQKDLSAKKADVLAKSAQVVSANNDLTKKQADAVKACAADMSVASNADACKKATQAVADANTALANAIAAQTAAATAANAAAGVVNPGTTTGAGFNLCGNGILATVCTAAMGGTKSPFTTGIVQGLSTSAGLGGGLGGLNSSTGVPSIACGAGFTSIGGVCFPSNTGLSNAPISTILANLFSWLMGLFTTLAIVAFVISGIQYVTAAGSQDQMETGKRNATYALLGIIIGLSGFVIIQAIAAALSGQGYFF